MKVDIITLHYINHYGSLLQTYATCKAFEKMGHITQIIDYVRPNAEVSVQMNAALSVKGFSKKSLKGILFIIIKSIENKKRKNFSEKFLQQYVSMTRPYKDLKDLSDDPPRADIYVTGSDQTWNSDYNGGLLPAYYLAFLPDDARRIGYAVSIGMPKFHENEVGMIKHYIEKYDAISVREKSAKIMIEEIGYSNVTQILDPTLVLEQCDWLPLVSKRVINGKYIIIYKLNDIPELEEFAEELSKKTGYKIIRMSYYINHFRFKGKMVYSPTVEEFLSLIFYSEFVITDSFHGLAFSLNFNKQFYVFYPEKYSSRLQSILELTKTTDRVILDPRDFKSTEVDYNYVNEILRNERIKAMKFIDNNCK